jgi:hypothetical protein
VTRELHHGPASLGKADEDMERAIDVEEVGKNVEGYE